MIDNQSSKIAVEQAIHRGNLQVKYPSMALLIGPLLAPLVVVALVGDDVVPDFAWVLVLVGAFGSSWLWWSVALPRWRVWAIENTADFGELVFQALSAQLMWPPGHFLERTEICPRSLRLRLQSSLRQALADYADVAPEDADALREFLDPWLQPNRRRTKTRPRGSSGGSLLIMLAGAGFLVVPVTRVVAHFVYGAGISWTGVAWVTPLCLLMILGGYSRSQVDLRLPTYLFLVCLGLGLCSMVLRSYPWRPVELFVLTVGVVMGGGAYLGLKAMGGDHG